MSPVLQTCFPLGLSLTGGHELHDDSLSLTAYPPLPPDPKSPRGFSPRIPQGYPAGLGTPVSEACGSASERQGRAWEMPGGA